MNYMGGFYLFEWGVIHMFKHVCNRDEEKPPPSSKKDMLKEIMCKFKCKASSVLIFDDHIVHYDTAVRMGVKAVSVDAKKLLTWRDVKRGLDLFDKRKRRYSLQF